MKFLAEIYHFQLWIFVLEHPQQLKVRRWLSRLAPTIVEDLRSQDSILSSADPEQAKFLFPLGPDFAVHAGVVKNYNEQLGFGYVSCDDVFAASNFDVYVTADEKNNMAYGGLHVGDAVGFRVLEQDGRFVGHRFFKLPIPCPPLPAPVLLHAQGKGKGGKGDGWRPQSPAQLLNPEFAQSNRRRDKLRQAMLDMRPRLGFYDGCHAQPPGGGAVLAMFAMHLAGKKGGKKGGMEDLEGPTMAPPGGHFG